MEHNWSDEWGNDTLVERAAPGYADGLSPRMRKLRDGADIPSSSMAVRRREDRIAELEKDHAKALSTLGELEKYRNHARHAECDKDVVEMMDRMIGQRVARFRAHADSIHGLITELRKTAR